MQATKADCIISTGGVSVGEEDHIKQAVSTLGHLDLWRIALKPGKPLAFGSVAKTPFFGLPGNPVSSFLTFLLLVRPYLLKLQGQIYHPPQTQWAQAQFSRRANPKRQEYLRVNIVDGLAYAYSNQSSGVLSSVVAVNGLAIIPIARTTNIGDRIETLLFSQLF